MLTTRRPALDSGEARSISPVDRSTYAAPTLTMRVSGPALALARAHTGPQLKGADQDSSQARWPELWVAVIRGTHCPAPRFRVIAILCLPGRADTGINWAAAAMHLGAGQRQQGEAGSPGRPLPAFVYPHKDVDGLKGLVHSSCQVVPD